MHAFLALVMFAAVPYDVAAAVAAPSTRRYDDLIVVHAQQRGLDPRLVKAMIAVESEFVPGAVSRAGARGLMQLMPATAQEMGTAPQRLHEPSANIAAGTKYLASLFSTELRRHGLKGTKSSHAPLRVIRRVVAAYNCGPSCLDGRPWPAETKAYVRRVLALYGAPLTALGPPEEAPPLVVAPVRTGAQAR